MISKRVICIFLCIGFICTYGLMASALTLSIPDVTADAGSTITTSINVDDATGIAGGQIELTYNPIQLMAEDVQGTDLTQGYSVVANTKVPGKINIAIAGVTGIPEGSGALFTLKIQIRPDAQAGDTEITFTQVGLFDESGNDIPVETSPGKITITQKCLKYPAWDVNQDGVVDILDLVLVGKHFGKAYHELPASPFVGHPRTPNAEGHLWLDVNAKFYPHRTLQVNVNITPVVDVYGYQFDLVYDEDALEIYSVTPGSTLKRDGAQAYWNVAQGGASIRVMHARQISVQGVDVNGTLATVIFRVKNSKSAWEHPVNLTNVKLADSSARSISVNIKDVNINLRSLFIPAQSRLLANYPNPFNPETWIPYQLVHSGNVMIAIHNAQGGLVRRIHLGYKSPGYYLNTLEAAHWDGRDSRGERVASGVYFYTIYSGEFAATRRMVIVK